MDFLDVDYMVLSIFAIVRLHDWRKVPSTEVKRRFRLWGNKDDGGQVGAIIGAPYNVQHVTHVKSDSHTSTGV